ncbi:MAG TPA: hypothetical protein DDX40_04320 [Rikenellaceae bacterium]|nr:hypothetical protein [Rikenellaceae bacterium]
MAESKIFGIVNLGLRLILSAALSALFDSQECMMHSWGTFFGLFGSRGCCLVLLGGIIFHFCLRKAIRHPALLNILVGVTGWRRAFEGLSGLLQGGDVQRYYLLCV